MAHAPSPRVSPPMRSNSIQNPSRLGLNGSPPSQPISKRDKRRTLVMDRLHDVQDSFAKNKDSHYRLQLQALQVDMTLINNANPYSEKPLEDAGEEIANMVNIAAGNSHAGVNGTQGGVQRKPEVVLTQAAGKLYAQFAEEVNNVMENRDASLTTLKSSHDSALRELYKSSDYKIRLALEEHKILANTIRERLVQVVEQKKTRLMREKDHLDIVDSNALLLHPNQFCIANPSSPSGAQSNRKTRHTRHRQGDAEDLSGMVIAGDGLYKRKRRGALEENDVGSPGPMGRVTDAGIASPLKDARSRLTAAQMDAPLYSVERLFTEKELSMHLNTAALATAHYFATLKVQGDENTNTIDGDRGSNGDNMDGDDMSGSGAGTTHEGDVDEDVPPATAPEMDRNANQSFHATRSTRNTTGATGLNLLGDLAMSTGKSKGLLSSLPIILPQSMITKTGQAPHPPGLRADDAEEDLNKIDKLVCDGSGLPDLKLLGDICTPLRRQSHNRVPLSELRSATTRANTAAIAPALAGLASIPMSTQSSLAGFSDIGGVAMNRLGEGSSTGAMKRTAGAAGFGSVGESEKRTKSR